MQRSGGSLLDIEVDIYRAVKWPFKYPPQGTDANVGSCFGVS